jgi:IS5 family transposase
MEFARSLLDAYVPAKHPLVLIRKHIDFSFVDALCAPFYSTSKEGQPEYPPELLFRICFLSFFENMSYRETVCRLEHDLLFRHFCDYWGFGHPSHATLSVFLKRVGADSIAECFNRIVEQAKAAGIVKHEVGAIDSTLVESHANRYRLWFEGGSPDPDAKWTSKRGKHYYGFKGHIHTDTESGIVTKRKATPGNESDMNNLEPLLDKDLKAETADKGYSSGDNRQAIKDNEQEDVIIPKNNEKTITIDKEKAKKRTQVERNFSVAKRCHRLSKTISWGIDAFSIQLDFALMAWNAKCWVKQLLNRPCWEWKAKCA